MKRNQIWVVLISTGAAVAVAVAVQHRSKPHVAPTAPAADAPSTSDKAPDERAVLDAFGGSSVVAEAKAIPYRKAAFAAAKQGFTAEGVALPTPGEIQLRSQLGGKDAPTITQKVIGARVLAKGKTPRELPRSGAPTAALGSDKTGERERATIRYAGMFEGLDLEYRYDGKDVEEFLHLTGALKQSLVQDGADLELRSVFPGLDEKHTLLRSAVASVPVTAGDTSASAGVVELGVGNGSSFYLPPAIAYDSAKKSRVLDRSFEWTKQGLEVAVRVPNDWLEQAEGEVMIDPSLVDGGYGLLQSLTWDGFNAVRDATDRIHVVYRANPGTNGDAPGIRLWYTSGDGTTWDPPRLVDPLWNEGETRDYTGNLVIDRSGTLHVLWADYTDNGTDPRGTRGRSGYGNHRVHYAKCANRCRPGNDWTFGGEVGGRVLFAGGYDYAWYRSMAVDQDDVVHILVGTYNNDIRFRYFQSRPDGTVAELASVFGGRRYSAQIVVDQNNDVYAISHGYEPPRDVAVARYDRGTNSWVARAGFDQHTGEGSAGDSHLIHAKVVVDRNNRMHVCWQIHAVGISSGWRNAYGVYTPSTNAWTDINLWPYTNPMIEHQCSLTVDDADNVHLFWTRYRAADGSNQEILYARKPPGGAWSTPATWPAGQTQNRAWPGVRPRLPWPLGRNPNRFVAVDQPELFFTNLNTEIRYSVHGRLVESPVLAGPEDGRFQNDTTPTFAWNRISLDNGSNTTYTLTYDTTPRFNANPVTINAGNNTSYTLSGTAPELMLDGRYYYWRVRAVNQTFGQGPFSVIWEVPVDTTPPSVFELLTPANGSTPATLQPTLTWEASTDPN